MSGISFWPIKIKTTVRERWFFFSVFHEHGTKKIPREELNLRPSDSALQRFITKPKRLYCEPRHFFCVSHFRVREKEILISENHHPWIQSTAVMITDWISIIPCKSNYFFHSSVWYWLIDWLSIINFYWFLTLILTRWNLLHYVSRFHR